MSRIYLSPPHVFGDERLLIDEAFATNWISPQGPHVDAFESEFADVVGVPHAVALSSGTAALHLAMRLLDIGPGDEVICSSLTFVGSANPIMYERATPIFIDCDATWTMDPNLLEDALRAANQRGVRPKAVIAVDLYGQCADYDAVCEICERFGVPLIEDAAEALGSSYKGRKAGAFGHLGVFSFNGNKIITTSGGGMLVCYDLALAQKARFLATQAREPALHYEHTTVGFNYRLSNILAGIGRAQLKTLDQRVTARRRIFDRYVESLESLPGVAFMPEPRVGVTNRWLTTLTIDSSQFGATSHAIQRALSADDIESRPVWKPMHMQPLFAGCLTYGGRVAQRLFEWGLCLPSGSSLSEQEQQRITSIIHRCRA